MSVASTAQGEEESALAKNLTDGPLVKMTNVPSRENYREYRTQLRYDFFYTCNYCYMCEFEGAGVRFTIDHYEPQSKRPDLASSYGNLMYCCDTCNISKGTLCPPENLRKDGKRFFRCDEDVFNEHYKGVGVRLEAITVMGQFNIDALRLNRQGLRRLRELRARYSKCQNSITEGIAALRRLRIDQLPADIRHKAQTAITKLNKTEEDLAQSIDDLLRQFARSCIIDEDEDPEEKRRHQAARLKAVGALHPRT